MLDVRHQAPRPRWLRCDHSVAVTNIGGSSTDLEEMTGDHADDD